MPVEATIDVTIKTRKRMRLLLAAIGFCRRLRLKAPTNFFVAVAIHLVARGPRHICRGYIGKRRIW